MTWKILKADSLPAADQMQELESQGWMVVSIVPDAGVFFIYLRRTA